MFINSKRSALTSLAAVVGITLATSAYAYDPADPTDTLNPANSVPKFEVTFTPPPPPSPSPAETPAPETGQNNPLTSLFDPFGLLAPARRAESGSRASKVVYPTAPAHHARHQSTHRLASGDDR